MDPQIPINVLRKERVPLNFLSSVSAQALGGIPMQEARHDALSFRADIRRELEWVTQDPLVHRVHVLVIEWRKASLRDIISQQHKDATPITRQTYHHLEQKHAQGPPIYSLSISLAFEQFRRNIFGGAAEGYAPPR